MNAERILAVVQDALVGAGVPYMLTGSFASAVHGTPRATQDIDLVIAPTRDQLLALLKRFPESEYYVHSEAALEALAEAGQFNVIVLEDGWKIDFIIRKPRDFSRVEFDRRRPVLIGDVAMDVASAEDVLIAKLEWAKLSHSARQLEDAAGIVRMQGNSLDLEYIRRWVSSLGLESQWNEAKRIS